MAAKPCMYLSAALDTIQTYALMRDSVNWDALYADAFDAARDATTIDETYPAIEQILQALGDNHSFLMRPKEVQDWEEGTDYETPSGRMLGDYLAPAPVAYLRLPGFNRVDEEHMRKYADTAQDIIWQLRNSDPCGWVVSLQGNGGGNMWPMLAGVGPLLGEGRVGAFIGHEDEIPWVYQDGAVKLGDHVIVEVPEPVAAADPNETPVAVLTSGATASAAEAIVIAFRGRPGARSFGQPTGGVPTGNVAFELSDGAKLLLTTSRMADRTNRIYNGRIAPDSLITSDSAVKGRTTLEIAAEWVALTAACQHSIE